MLYSVAYFVLSLAIAVFSLRFFPYRIWKALDDCGSQSSISGFSWYCLFSSRGKSQLKESELLWTVIIRMITWPFFLIAVFALIPFVEILAKLCIYINRILSPVIARLFLPNKKHAAENEDVAG